MSVAGGSRRAVFLDRDGVLIRALVREGRPFSALRPRELELLPGVEEACHKLREAGFVLVAVTNQPDIARGLASADAVESLNASLSTHLGLDDIVACPHDDADRCDCRKPAPGMLISSARRFGVDLTRSYMVGDRWRDIEAGRRAGVTTIHVAAGYDEPAPVDPDAVVTGLPEAVAWILERLSWDACDR
jgi:D-glycero-D-manno-heptose 1,7-bisphosphate phosphatase